MWGWKPAKRALEHLFAAGELAIAGRQGFQRVYDLPERVIPRSQLDAPTPSETEFRRGYALRAVEGRGALTESGIAEHCRFDGGAREIRPHVDALVDDGHVRRVEVDDGGPPVVVPAGVELDELDGAPAAAVLLCPFDNLMWDRPFLRRLFGFDHLIEVYKREHERRLRLLRAAAAARRSARRARRPQGRPRPRRAARQALHARAGRPPLASTSRSSAPPHASRARSGSRRSSADGARKPGRQARDRRPGGRRIRSAGGVRDPRDPRRPGAGPGDRRGDHADLPDLDLRAGGGRREQGLRLLARRRTRPARRSRRRSRASSRRGARRRVLVRARRDDDADAPRRPGPARRPDRRRLRRRLPDDLAGLRAEGLPLHLRPGRGVRREPRALPRRRRRAWSGSRRRPTRS